MHQNSGMSMRTFMALSGASGFLNMVFMRSDKDGLLDGMLYSLSGASARVRKLRETSSKGKPLWSGAAL